MAAPQAPQKTQHHELLDSFVGKFRAEVTVWFGNDQSHTSTGTMVNTFHLEGLYLHQDYNGDAPAEGGPTFLGKGYWGYNTTTEQFEGFWIDNASTTMQLEKGTVDDSGTTWTMLSQFIVPGQGVLHRLPSLLALGQPGADAG